MKVYVYIDPEYNGSVWCANTVKGLTAEASRRHYGIYFLENENIFSLDLDKIYGDEESRVLIILTTRVITDSSFYEHFAKNGVSLLFVNHQSHFAAENYSNILVDYRKGMASLTAYLAACGKSNIALFAVNPASATDQIKKEYFLSAGIGKERDIFYNNGSLDDCCNGFFGTNDYDSVICANDIAACCLLNFLGKKGVKVPGDIYLTSFGDSVISQLSVPSLTTVSVDHTGLGKEALHAYSYLYRREKGIRATFYVTPKLNIRESTDFKKLRDSINDNTLVYQSDDRMYSDSTAQKILGLEKMLSSCDENDIKILKLMIDGKTYSKIADELFLSEKTVAYRVSCMRNVMGCSTKEELCKTVKEYISL